MKRKVHEPRYFLGVDPAPSRGPQADDGALVVVRAQCMAEEETSNESEWAADLVWARRVKRADGARWSGHIHEKHQDFGFTRILMDKGGGGDWIEPELRKPIQEINGVEVRCTPIVPVQSASIEGSQILMSLVRSESELRKLFPDLKNARGDDVLKDKMNSLLCLAMEKGMLGLPEDYNKCDPKVREGWTQEKKWASKLLTVTARQMVAVRVETDEQGAFKQTRNGSKIFVCAGKDDFHDAARNAYVAFRAWLAGNSMSGFTLKECDRALSG